MTSKKNIKIIVEKRSDAIHICNTALISNLKKIDATIKVIYLNNLPTKNCYINFLLEIFNTLKIMLTVGRDDIILFTDPISFNSLASIFMKNKKYIIFYHYENDPFYYKYIPYISYKKVLDSFDGIIGISNFSLEQLASLNIDTKKCKAIYYGIDHDLFKPSASRIYPFDYILSIGSEEPRKNMKNILKAFKILKEDYPNIKLLKTGKASIANRQQTLDYIDKLQLNDSVIFTDFVEEKKLPQIYSGAKLLLFPSLLEGFGLPIVEAMACGCPVITSNRNPMKELVGLEQITIDPMNPNEIATVCKKILSDENHRNLLIKKGLERAKEFGWENTANSIYEFIIK